MVVKKAYEYGRTKLSEHGTETPDIDARAILEDILGIEFGKLSLYHDQELSKEQADIYIQNIEKRCKNMPLSYITNKKEFYSFSFYVNEGVLIPRPETENLVTAVLENLPDKKDIKIADLCSGSGCIGITIALKTGFHVQLFELSEEAIEISKINCNKLHAKNIKITKMDILSEELTEGFDVIVSNPPYIPADDLEYVMPEVRNFEPEMALTDNEDGLKFYKRIAELAKKSLNKGGILAVEVGINQHNLVKDILTKTFPHSKTEVITDYFGVERVLITKL